ncbi:MAG: cell division protein FtsQ/DivIB [Candidatus Promineifilaceae bacterium]
MRIAVDRKQQKRLRKQPKLRRVQTTASASLPHIVVPPTAKKRRRRNRAHMRLPLSAVRQIATSSRWISLTLLLICAGALLLVHQDESFYLTWIPVEGAGSISAAEVVSASGLAGSHVFAVDPSEAAARIGELPGVISATVTLNWPNEVSIQVGEDSPIAIWEQAGRQYWINDRGRLLPIRSDRAGLLHIVSEERKAASEDQFIPSTVLQGALQLRELRPNIYRLSYSPGTGLAFEDGRGWRVYFGSGLDMAQKLAVYETLVDDLLARDVAPEYVSVKNQEKPFYMPRAN